VNATATACAICGEAAQAGEWLSCLLCGKHYHFALAGEGAHADCGIVARNPNSSGC
jgi:hypothetical protein